MSVYHPDDSQPQSPEYWWGEADDMFSDAKKAVSAGLTRKTVCNLLHGSIERELKALLNEQGRLTDGDRTHSLVALANRAGLMGSLPVDMRLYLHETSSLHSDASYPRADLQFHIWYDDANYKAYIIMSGRTYRYLRGKRGKGGDADGGIGGGQEAGPDRP